MPDLTPQANYDQTGLGSYRDYDMEQSYEYDTGVIAVPLAGAVPGMRKVRLHGGYGLRVAQWKAQRAGKPPIIPSMADTTGDTFLAGSVNMSLPRGNPEASGYNWDVSGTYTYIQLTPRRVGQVTFSAGGYPYPIGGVDQLAQDIGKPGFDAAAAAEAAGTDPVDAFGKAVQPTEQDRANDTYLWPFTVLPPGFTNDHLIGG